MHPIASADADANQRLLRGTAGFGFWNYPLSLTGAVLRPPDAIWFFGASQPSNMALVPGMPGWGWKAKSSTRIASARSPPRPDGAQRAVGTRQRA